jgi:hypothetical protein
LALSLGVRDYKVIDLRTPGFLEEGRKIFSADARTDFGAKISPLGADRPVFPCRRLHLALLPSILLH